MLKKSLLLMLLMALLAPWAVAQQTLPYNYGFEDNDLSADGWTTTCTSTSSGIQTNAAHSGSYGFTFYYNEQNGYLVSPLLTGAANGLDLSFYYKEYSSSYGDEQFQVGYTTDASNTDASTFTYGDVVTASTSWQTYTNSFPAGTVRIAVKYIYNDAFYLFLDDFTFEPGASCKTPTDLTATNLTTESATLGWTAPDPAPSNGYNVRYRTSVIEHPYYLDDFETNSLTGWTIYTDGDAPQSDGWYTINPESGLDFSAHSGSYCASAWSWSNQAYDADNWLISPQVPLTGTLRFYVRTNAVYPDSYEVLLSTTGTAEADFTVTLQAMAPAPTTGVWEEVSIDLKSYSGNGYIAIHHVSNDANYLLIDDFGIFDSPTPAGAWVNKTTSTNSLNISGLTEETSYDFEVQSNCGSGETSEWASSTFTTNPNCMPVANLAVSDATTTTISLTWTDQNSGSASYIVTDGDDNPVTVTNLTTTGCTVTGLTANTAYTFKVKADCGSTAETINVRTECNALSTLPYEEGFEASSVNFYCWDLYGFSRLNNSTYAHDGTYSIYSQEALAYAILPATTTNISDLMLNFWWYNAASGYDLGSLAVGYLTDETDYSTFVTVGTIDMSSSSSTYTKTDDYAFAGAPAGARIALKYTEGSSGAQVIIDDVTVDNAPNCMKPTALGATPSSTSAVLNWTANSGETSWNIYYKKTSETDYIEVSNVKENPYTLTPLVANTNYEYYVVANCSPTEPSDPSAVYSFKTQCGAVTTFPWDEDFEGMTASTVPECWDNSASTAQEITSNPQYIWGVYEYSSNKMIRMYNYYVHTGTALINSPSIDLPSTGVYQLTFDYAHNASCGAFKVNISDDNGTTWVEKGSYTKGSGSSSSDPGTFTSADPILLGDYAGKTILIQFFANANYGSGAIFVDNVLINEAPNCIAPNGLGATPSTTSAELSWTANSGETSWNIYYKKTSETDYTELKKVTDNPYTLPGLDPATDYEFYVKANCTATETSDPSSVYYFSTECTAFTITATDKYIQDFESPVVTSGYSSTTDLHVPNCWENPYTTGSSAAGKPHLIAKGSSYNYSSGQVLNFYGSGSNYVTLPEFTNNLQDLQISFKWATESNSNGTLTLGYITDGDVNYNTFAEITGASYPASSSSYHTLIQADPVDLSALPATAKRLAFRWVYTGQYSCNVDDLVVELIPSCKIPTNFTCTDYTATTATFDWTPSGTNQTAWQLYISDKNIAPANNIAQSEVINVTTHPYTVTSGLVAEQTYYAWVRGNCTASSEGYSEWSEGIEFMPSQYKDFTYQETAGSYTSYLPVYGSYASYATNKGQVLIPATYFPAEMTDATVRRLTFYTTSSYASVNWGTAEFDVLVTEVDATSFATAEFFDWNAMTTVYSGSLSVSNNQMVIDLDTPFSYTGGNLVIGFNLTATGTNGYVNWVAAYGSTYLGAYQYGTNSVSRIMYQPKTTFNYLPNPTPRPINPHATEELSTEATVAWTAPNSSDVTGYQYQYKLATTTEWPTYYYDETGLSANMTGLTPEKTYDFRVRAVYPGPAYSQYAETQFTTTAACAIPDGLAAANLTMNTADLTWNASTEVANYTVEYRTAAYYDLFQGFENGFEGWTVINESTSSGSPNNVPDINTAAKRTDNYGFRFSSWNTSSTGYDQYLISPMISFTGKVKFYYREQTTSYGDEKFKVGYSSTDNSISSFTWGDVVVVSNDAYADDKYYEEAIPDGTKYVAIYYCTGASVSRLFIDDITLGNLNPAGTWQTATTAAPNTGAYTIEGLTAGIKYDIRVYANCTTDPDSESTTTTITTLADGTKVFNNAAGDGMWSTATNWTPNGAPTISENAVLRASATITGAATANKITFEGTTTPTLTINDGGTLQTNNNVAAIVKKHITGYTAAHHDEAVGYYLIANPLNSTVYSSSFATVGLTSGNYDIYSWSYSASDGNEWRNFRAGSFSSLTPQTGYLYANESDVDFTFTGTVAANNADVTKSLNYASSGSYAFNGWNLVGNPFVCNAYTKDATSTDIAFYRMNNAGSGFEAATGAIKPMEGIFVKATATSQSFNFTREQPITGYGNGNLNISLANVVTSRDAVATTDKAIVRFDGGGTLEKFMFREDNMKIYIPQDGTDFAVVASEAKGMLPVNVKVTTTGNYTISISNEDVDFTYLHLIDRLTGEDVDLLIEDSYTFNASPRDQENRFTLVFNSIDSNIDATSEIFAYQNGDEIIVSGEGTLQVYDVMGRFVASYNVNGTESINASQFENAVYIFRLVGTDVKTQKIVVR